jgi:hypothetical protein
MAPATIINADITTDTTWTKSGSPYTVTKPLFIVAQGATLTVDPGVQVRFDQNARMRVNGGLSAIGTVTEPITFTGTTMQSGWWGGISFEGSPSNPLKGSIMDHVVVEYGGFWSPNYNVRIWHAHLVLSHAIIRQSSGDGLQGAAGGVADVSDTTFVGNQSYAIHFTDGSVNPLLARLGASGNGVDGVGLGLGTLQGNHEWEYTGIPYLVTGFESVGAGAMLNIEPGVEVRFEQSVRLDVNGVLKAIGNATDPITFTGTTGQPGWWGGISFEGNQNSPLAGSIMDHVVVEYGGSWSPGYNVRIWHGRVAFSHATIRQSSGDGLHIANGGGGSVIEASQIVSNTNYGVNNTDTGMLLLASNNWWGSANGPTPDNASCNSGGTGSRVTEDVVFGPYLTSASADPGPVAPSDAYIISATPDRWFVPADDVTQAQIIVTVRDGSGQPLPGRQVNVSTSRGSVQAAGTTDVKGQVLALAKSSSTGDADIRVLLFTTNPCETARPAETRVTFTPFDTSPDLFPGTAAPYVNGGLTIAPEPVVRGISTTLNVRITNPNTFSISVNGTFGVVQSSIGLVFGPIGQVQGEIIPPLGQKTVRAEWTPAVSGHVCVRFDYAWQASPLNIIAAVIQTDWAGDNTNIGAGSLGSPGEKEQLDKADKVWGVVSKAPAGPTHVQKGMLNQWWKWVKESARDISVSLGGDPPRQDYRIIAMPQKVALPPLLAGGQISQARADAHNAITDALLDVIAFGDAAVISLDRYGGAAAAADLHWSAQQAAALIYYKEQMGQALLNAANATDAFIQVVQTEGSPQYLISMTEVISYQNRISTQGFSLAEIADAKVFGLTDAQIEAIRQADIAADPGDVAGDLLIHLANEADAMRALGNTLAGPANFPLNNIATGRSLAASTANNNLSRVYETATTFVVGNPLSQTTTIDLDVRRIDLPSDWGVTISPTSVTLDPGQQITASLRLHPGTAAVQGTMPRVAIEGYASGTLLSGVVFDVVVPQAAFFNGMLQVYLPSISNP